MLQRTDPELLHLALARTRRRRRRWPYLLLLPVLLAGALAYTYWAGAGTAPQARYNFASVTRQTIEDNVAAVGSLTPLRSVEVGSQVSGQLTALHVAVGDRVEAGQLLAEMDPAIYESTVEATEAQLDQLQAQLANAEAQLVLAHAVFNRQQSLSSSAAGLRSELETAVAGLASAQAGVDGIKAQIRERRSDLRRAEANLGYTKIYAPLAGTVVSQPAEQGQTLSAQQSAPTIVTIADLSTMTVEAEVSEADIARLRPGMEAWFTTLGDSQTRWTGTLRLIRPTPVAENNVVVYTALFDVPNPDGVLMIDMTAQVFFVSAKAEDVLTVPAAAVRSGRGEASVLVRDGTEVSPRPVEVGLRTRAVAEIRSGLDEGEEVVAGERPAASATRAGQSGQRGGDFGSRGPGGGPGGPPPF